MDQSDFLVTRVRWRSPIAVSPYSGAIKSSSLMCIGMLRNMPTAWVFSSFLVMNPPIPMNNAFYGIITGGVKQRCYFR